MVLYEMHLDHMHEINYITARNMDEQLFTKRRYFYYKIEDKLPLSVSNFRYASISESGEPKEKNSFTSNANIKP
jgi:hypothetical protein